ncbi:MAG: hypothetical protein N3G80_00755 [Candidatus Micrarchaeota archaeon]|nr:hypothetical protein [Candidatus Micrarchaeota archaeon]
MPKAVVGGQIQQCYQELEKLEAESGEVIDEFVQAVAKAPKFHSKIEKIEEMIALIEKLQASESDLQLNESIVLAERAEEEILEAQNLALHAALSEKAEEWSEKFEQSKQMLEKMRMHLKKAEAESAEGEALEVALLIAKFRQDAKKCREIHKDLKKALSSHKKTKALVKVRKARNRLYSLKSNIGKIVRQIAKKRLSKQIAYMHQKIMETMLQTKGGKVVLDFKNLTITADGTNLRLPLTDAAAFAFCELAPGIEKLVEKAAKGEAIIIGRYRADGASNRIILMLGERTAAGDAIVYRQQQFVLPPGQ